MRAIISILLAMCGVLSCLATDITNRTKSAQQKPPQVKTIFEEDAKLTDQEVKQVLSLARQCGIDQPAEIRTFHYLPGGRKGVSVKNVEVIKGADITFDEITIGKNGWIDWENKKDAKRVGVFWAVPSNKYTKHFRVYDFRGEKIRINIGSGVSAELADKIIPLIAAKTFRYPDDGLDNYWRDELKKMIGSKPNGISKPFGGESKKDSKFWLNFEGTLNALQFRFEKGEVILEQVIHINV